MATRWTWGSIEPKEFRQPIAIAPHPELFDTKESARASMQRALDTFEEDSPGAQAAKLLRRAEWSSEDLLIVCPPTIAWVIYPVRDDLSTSTAGYFYLLEHRSEVTRRLLGSRENTISTDFGCALIALAATGTLIAGAVVGAFAISQIPWGA